MFSSLVAQFVAAEADEDAFAGLDTLDAINAALTAASLDPPLPLRDARFRDDPGVTTPTPALGATTRGARIMAGWTRGETTEGNGYMWENEEEGVSAFEDTSEGYSQWYAWRGDTFAHETAEHTDVYPTRDEAVAALDR